MGRDFDACIDRPVRSALELSQTLNSRRLRVLKCFRQRRLAVESFGQSSFCEVSHESVVTELSPLAHNEKPCTGRCPLAVTFSTFQRFSEGAFVAKPQTTKILERPRLVVKSAKTSRHRWFRDLQEVTKPCCRSRRPPA
jgi:hypothetical protein